MENSTPNLFKQRILLLLTRFLIAVVAPLIIFAVKWEVFRTKEALGGFGVFCFALVGIFSLKGLFAGVVKNIPNRFAYVPTMLGFPALMLLGIGCVYLFTALSDKLLYVFTITLICNVISLPFTIWYNHILYEIYGDAVKEHISEGIFSALKKYKKNNPNP